MSIDISYDFQPDQALLLFIGWHDNVYAPTFTDKMDYRESNIKRSISKREYEHKIRVLIIDRDVLVRQLIAKIIRSHSSLNIVGSCSMIEPALDMIRKLEPDVVFIDVSHLKGDGASVFEKIRKTYPLLPVILLSHRTEHDAVYVINGLEMGAFDYITKPESIGMLLSAGNHFKKRVIPTIQAAVYERRKNEKLYKKPDELTSLKKHKTRKPVLDSLSPINAVVIGGCTGGPVAIFSILSVLPADFPVPIVIAQHMPKIYTKTFAAELKRKTRLNVMEGFNGAQLRPGQVWIAPGGYHITIRRDNNYPRLFIHRGPRENTCRPSIDVLFRSAAETFGSGLLAVVVSGRGIDGVTGCRFIKEQGGQIIVQDRNSSGAWELPGSLVHNKLADDVCHIEEMGKVISERVHKSRIQFLSAG